MNEIQKIKSNHNVTPLFKLPNAEKVVNIIDKNLRHDWVVRIEHTDSVVLYDTQWQQWGETRYAIKSSAKIMEDIYACRARFSKHSVRLSAEKIRSQTKMIFSVYRPEHAMEDETCPLDETKSVITVSEVAKANKNNWPVQFYRLMDKVRAKVWQTVAIVGVLIMSLLLIEEIAVH